MGLKEKRVWLLLAMFLVGVWRKDGVLRNGVLGIRVVSNRNEHEEMEFADMVAGCNAAIVPLP